MIPVTIVLGTKAQLIKMAPIMAELQRRGFGYWFVFTGQHQETMDELRANFGLKEPDVVLYEGPDIVRIPQLLLWSIRIFFKTIFQMRTVFPPEKRGILLTHGDTTSTVLGALLGKLSRQRVAHIESGLRSFHVFKPFPEELNRLITFRLSDVAFAPGEWAYNNLAPYRLKRVNVYHNTLYDALQLAVSRKDTLSISLPVNQYAVVSIHRFENIFRVSRLRWIVEQLQEISKTMPLLFILHPPTEKALKRESLFSSLEQEKHIHLLNRQDYVKFIAILSDAQFLISDGGSNQEESSYLGLPTILFRDETERVEGINENVILSKYDTDVIDHFVGDYKQYRRPAVRFETSPTQIIVDYLAANTI